MSDIALRRLATVVSAAAVCLGTAGFLLKQNVTSEDVYGIPFFAFSLVGLVVVFRQPRNRIGWVFLVAGSAPTIGTFFTSSYALYAIRTDLPGALIAEWVSSWAWFPGIAAFVTFGLLLFPDGCLPSQRWRPVGYLGILMIVLVTAALALQPGLMQPFEATLPSHTNPFGWESGAAVIEAVLAVGFPFLPLLGLAGAASLIFRYRNEAGEQRQQIKWFAYTASVLVVVVALEGVLENLLGQGSSFLFVFAMVLPSVGAGIGILRYRLYEIDLVINRTLVYALLTAALVFAYLGIVFVLQQLLSGITQESDLAVAGSTLAVAALFRPLRARVQGFIDRRFYRRKYDAHRTLEAFSVRLRDDVDLDHLSTDLARVVRETMQPVHVSVWLREARM